MTLETIFKSRHFHKNSIENSHLNFNERTSLEFSSYFLKTYFPFWIIIVELILQIFRRFQNGFKYFLKLQFFFP